MDLEPRHRYNWDLQDPVLFRFGNESSQRTLAQCELVHGVVNAGATTKTQGIDFLYVGQVKENKQQA